MPRIDKPGRILACELMFANFAIRNNIRSGKTESLFQTIQTSAGEGMQTLDQCLIRLVKEGLIDYETAKPYIFDKFTHETIAKIPPRLFLPEDVHPAVHREEPVSDPRLLASPGPNAAIPGCPRRVRPSRATVAVEWAARLPGEVARPSGRNPLPPGSRRGIGSHRRGRCKTEKTPEGVRS
ncbi:MAG: hypothetical protein MZU84_05700 [Sphingobacterium sp.]|nr:hypothetical protein [Sphingobacterium sp.]